MNGQQVKIQICERELAAAVIEKFGSADVFSIAEQSGVKIVCESWFPVTFGEYDRKSKTIVVNLRAAESHEKIIAHELGHFFAEGLNLTGAEEESFAHHFAEYLTAGRGLKN